MAALRRLAATRHLISANIQRSLSSSPFSLRRDNHHSIQPPHTITQIPSFSPPSSFSNVFDPLAASTRTATQGQVMSHPMDKCNPPPSASGILGTGLAMGRARELLFLNMYKYDGVRMEVKRSFSSSAESKVEMSNEKIQPNANIIRPLSPHLPIYKPQTNSVASIFNRISGAYLAALTVVFYLLTIKMGPICFTYYPFYQLFFYASKCALISGELAILAIVYHVFHSFPHLFSDLVALITLRRK
ncbi:hypothetical protein KSS87_012464 [Heliosperma pusillum]|nr:hypothetical protein KSS87_012464 [Heliosperma pusillum]